MNAKDELLEHLEGRQVSAARIYRQEHYEPKMVEAYDDGDDWLSFLKAIDFEYDDGYGRQELFGTIWYTDGTWSERGEYDGSEWWEHRSRPEIPKR